MCTIEGLSNNPAEAYQQGRRDGAADALHSVELAATDSQHQQDEICADIIESTYPCDYCTNGCDFKRIGTCGDGYPDFVGRKLRPC